ncbi:MAG: phenylalanine--tRNA ligase subunit beta [Patescibacteria group bacterium]
MKVSRSWLQKYFEAELPSIPAIDDALTFHAFEIEEVISDDVIDLKVLPDRAGYGLSHRGIAHELSAILKMPMKMDPLRVPVSAFPPTDKLVITQDDTYVLRHAGALVRGIKVGPSPDWLKTALEAVGQRSINNIVDILNYVMLDIGQPAGAFDVGTLKKDDDVVKIDIRRAKKGEKITILTGEEYELTDAMFVFTDAVGGTLLDVAGIKGGKSSGVTEKTTDLFISVGNYDGTLLRRASQALKIFTDASTRYQNRPSPELVGYGMRDVLALIKQVAGGELVGVVDEYPRKPVARTVSVTRKNIEEILGAEYSETVIEDVFARLGFSFSKNGDAYVVTPPFERIDINVMQDLVEEVGRIAGYDHVATKAMTASGSVPKNEVIAACNAVRDILAKEGYSEISSYVFQDVGDVEMAKPLADDKKFLRPSFERGHMRAIEQNGPNLPLFNAKDLKLFEIGAVWPKGKEKLILGVTHWTPEKSANKKTDAALGAVSEFLSAAAGKPLSSARIGNTLQFEISQLIGVLSATNAKPPSLTYQQFSLYPFVLRDIAVWVPDGVAASAVESIIREKAGALLKRCDLFDTFSKEGRTSYAYRLVFQSMDKTLTDAEVNAWMKVVTDTLHEQLNWQVR